MWSKLRRWILPPKPAVDPAFVARMHDARAFGVEQRKASVQSRRELQRDRDERPDPTGIPTVDVLRGTYDPQARIYRGDGRQR